MASNKNQITQEIQVVRNETELGANTKDRIAQIFDDINYYTIEMPVTYSSGQTLNTQQQTQARNNIAAASNLFNYTSGGTPTFNGLPLSYSNSVTGSSTNGNIIINGNETPVYRLPSTLSPSIIAQDSNNLFVTSGQTINWNLAYSQTHTHTNKSLLDTYTQSDSDIQSAVSLKHNPVSIGVSNGLTISGQSLSMNLANNSTTGSLSYIDWNRFNNKMDSFGYTPENVANKVNDLNSPSSATYPTSLLLYNQLYTKVDKISGYSLVSNTDIAKIHVQNTDYQLMQPNGTNPFVYTDNDGNLHIDGNIIQSGTTYQTHAEDFYTTKDIVYTRDGATSGLANGSYTGIQAKLYDGVNDGQLVFDNKGIARVGDVGSLQPLATREETPINYGIAYWNSANNKFLTSLNPIAQSFVTSGGTSSQFVKGNGTLDNNSYYYSGNFIAETNYEVPLPITPSNPSTMFLNGNKQWSSISIGSGSYASNLYLSSGSSSVYSYYNLSYTPDSSATALTNNITNQELLFATYLYTSSLETNIIDAGLWTFISYAYVSNSGSTTQIKYEIFVRHTDNSETTLFSIYSDNITLLSSHIYSTQTTQNEFSISNSDILGLRIYGKTNSLFSVTLNISIGDGQGGYFNTPLRLRHTQLRGWNDDVNYLHSTQAQQNIWTNGSVATASSPLSFSGNTLSISQATTSTNGYLSSTDWNTFNGKQNQLNGTGFVKANGTSITYDNSTYLTGNQSITLSGILSGSGTTSISVAAASGYYMPTTTNQTNWNTAYNKYLTSASLTTSQLALTLNDSSTVTASVPTWNQNTTGTSSNVTGIILPINGGTGQTSLLGVQNWLGLSSAAYQPVYSFLSSSGGTVNGNITASKFITSGGTSSQFVKGNGSLDSTTYTPSTSAATVSLSVANWSSVTDSNAFYYYTVSDSGVTTSSWIDAVFANTDYSNILTAGIQPNITTNNGNFIIESVSIPSSDLTLTYKIIKGL